MLNPRHQHRSYPGRYLAALDLLLDAMGMFLFLLLGVAFGICVNQGQSSGCRESIERVSDNQIDLC